MHDIPHVTDPPQSDFQEPRTGLCGWKVRLHFNLCTRTHVSWKSAKLLTQIPSLSLFAWSKYKHNSCSDPVPLPLLVPVHRGLLLWPHLWNLMCDQDNPDEEPDGASWHCKVPEWHLILFLAVCKATGWAKQNKLSWAQVSNVLTIVSPEAGSRCRSGHNGAQEEADFFVRISCLTHWLWPFHKRGMDETGTSVHRKGKGQKTCIYVQIR